MQTISLDSPQGREWIRQARRQYRPLVPTSGLYLRRSQAAEEERFISVFRATWKRLPLGSRRRLVKYWRASPHRSSDARLLGLPSPRVEISWEWSGRPPTTAAMWQPYAQALRFWAPVVQLLPSELLATLIAHELAHAYCEAMGYHDPETYPDAIADEEDDWVSQVETDVREQVADWGFDEDALSEWFAIHQPEILVLYAARVEELEALCPPSERERNTAAAAGQGAAYRRLSVRPAVSAGTRPRETPAPLRSLGAEGARDRTGRRPARECQPVPT